MVTYDQIKRIPPAKKTPVDDMVRNLEAWVKTIREHDVSSFSLKQRRLKSAFATSVNELIDKKQVLIERHQLDLIRDELFTR